MEPEKAVEELASRVTLLAKKHEVLRDPVYLFMWLRHSKFNVDVTAQQIEERFAWRDELNVVEEPEPIQEGFSLSYEALKDGAVGVFVNIENVDFRRMLKSFGFKHVFKLWMYHIFEVERAIVGTLDGVKDPELGFHGWENRYSRGSMFVNVKGMSLSQATSLQLIKLLVDVVTAFVKNLPEVPKKIVFVNGSRVFKMFLRALEPLMPSATKLEMYSEGDHSWMEQWEDVLDIDQIPVTFGGNKKVTSAYDLWLTKQNQARTNA